MTNDELLKTIRDLQRRNPTYKQTTVYPHISEDSLDLVKSDFPEYNPLEEIPLVFCQGYTEGYQLRWVFISNKRLYYRISYFPPILTALDSVPLQKIQSLKIHFRWVEVIIELNRETIGTFIISSIRETLFLKKTINVILDNYESNTDIIEEPAKINYYPPGEWQSLDNANLFPLVNDYFMKNNKGGRLWGFCHFFTHPYIKSEKINLAREAYADYDPEQEIPLLYVDNLGLRTAGIVLTNKYVYYCLKPSMTKREEKGKLSLDKLYSFKIKSRIWGWIFINNQQIGMTNAFYFLDRIAARAFQDLVNLIIQEAKKTN